MRKKDELSHESGKKFVLLQIILNLRGTKMTGMPELLEYEMGSGVRAFSTTRRGGCSTGAYSEFNINYYCGDDDGAIAMNREALCRMLGITDDRLIMPHQVHLTEILRIDEAFLRLKEEERQQLLEGVDAVMTDVPGACVGVSTADCIPLLLYDEAHRAVCAVHAGWRGTVARIAEKAVSEMQEAYGTRPESLRAQIGPGISLESFEVGDEVYDAFAQAGFDMQAISRKYPTPITHHLQTSPRPTVVQPPATDKCRCGGATNSPLPHLHLQELRHLFLCPSVGYSLRPHLHRNLS